MAQILSGPVPQFADDLADPSEPRPDSAFLQDYANRVVGRGLKMLETYETQRSAMGTKTRYYSLVHAYDIEPQSVNQRPSQVQLAETFGLSVKAVERQLAHARERMRAWLLEELTQTATSADELTQEIQFLMDHCRGLIGGLLEDSR